MTAMRSFSISALRIRDLDSADNAFCQPKARAIMSQTRRPKFRPYGDGRLADAEQQNDACPEFRGRSVENQFVPALSVRPRFLVGSLPWLLAALAGAYLVSRAASRHPAAVQLAAREARVARQAYSHPTILYSEPLIAVVKKAGTGRDVFADFPTFETAWKGAAGNKPLTLTFSHRPITEPLTGKSLPEKTRWPRRVTESTFQEVLPLLREIAALILTGDGIGRGSLARSGYTVEPEAQPPANIKD
jgi:hypothetical protein